MWSTKVLIAALAVAAFAAAQAQDCEATCKPKAVAATKCTTMACACYAYDDPDYVDCLRSECGQGFDSIREIQVLTCSYMGVTLSPDPPGTAASTTQTGVQSTVASNTLTTSGSGSGGTQTTPTQSTSSPTAGSSSTSSGSGSGSGSVSQSGSGSSTSSSTSSTAQPSKDGLTTAELIGIIIGAVSAVATIIGVWVGIKRRNRGRENSGPAAPVLYHQIQRPADNVNTFAPVHNIHIAPIYHGNGPPPGYQQSPGYQQPPIYQQPPAYHPQRMDRK